MIPNRTKEQPRPSTEWAADPELLAFLRRFARRFEPEDWEDLVQSVYQRALTRSEQFRGGSRRAWLARILVNLFRDRRRRLRTRPETADPLRVDRYSRPAQDTTPIEALETLSMDDVREALQKVDPRFARSFELKLEGCSYQQIAIREGISPGTVGSRIARAKLQLRQVLEDRLRSGEIRREEVPS